MTTSPSPAHLVERAAQRLQAAADLLGQTGPREQQAAAGPSQLDPERVPIADRPDTARPFPDRPLAERVVPDLPLPSSGPALTLLGPPYVAPGPTEGEGPRQEAGRLLDMTDLSRAGMIAWAQRSRITEEFRVAQAQVVRHMPAASSVAEGVLANTVMVTSSRPDEGKTFSSLNLAAGIARYGELPVLLVDADSKPGSLTHLLGLDEAPGLLDLALAPARTPNEMVVRTAVANLSFLPIGGADGRRAEISASISLPTVIGRIARRFPNCIVLLDAPPCLSSSDPSTLAPSVGQIVFVVEAEKTPRNELESSLELIHACQNVMLLLNKIRLTANDTFGYYS